ncbi:FMN-binding negative transcriptional regulator [Polynucleobacter sinensis]|uniref:FMN-binding negative transcriptional regulator n=1 Tax=Polynucleobacter sinensis TaxID=1743157 RepID=UPI000783A973|nr:FMN-binding negative transcriptional regulator [Polynucleobacter sinensis]
MYIPSHFSETDLERVSEFIRANPLGLMVANVEGELVGNHLPFSMLDEKIQVGSKLISHAAKANPVWRLGESNEKVLLVFSGYETYISPSLYPSKQETHKVVPTYNYVSVHIYGRVRAIDDEQSKRQIVEALTNDMESDRQSPWTVSDAPEDYIKTMLANIVGLELLVEKIEAKWKASQNRPAKDRQGVIDGLRKDMDNSRSQEMAREIERREGRKG